MKKTIKYSLALLMLCSIVSTSQVFKTTISSIYIDDVKVIKPDFADLKVKSDQRLLFVLGNNFTEHDESIIYYRIFIDNKLVEEYYNSENYTITDLSSGVHIIKIQAYNSSGKEAIPIQKKFIVDPGVTAVKMINLFEISDVQIIYALYAILLLLIGLIFFLSAKLKSVKQGVNRGGVKTDVLMSDLDKVNEHNIILKRGYKKIEDENKRLKKTIGQLNKNIQSLEEANINLMEQKEALIEKKLKLEDLQKQKEELLAIKFHDIKNPAQAIQGFVELLESYDLTAQEQQEIMESIVLSTGNIMELVQSISETFAKENFEDEYIMELSSLQTVIHSVVTINSAYAKKKQIRLLNNSSQSMPEFVFDPLKVKEAIDNLVNNAVKYSYPNNDVTIRSFLTETHARVEVKDNGVGMTEKDLEKVFEKGAKLSSKPTGGEKSSGLGLWIVKKIVEAHDGKVYVESKKGIGSKFTFELPIKF
ncbi:MAG: HAMP domain-containing histidine kinase [Melioribacteraceae bacterium]|nr:HAMP domain-containing histidine kinase [Melioribacteraceae bacterium]